MLDLILFFHKLAQVAIQEEYITNEQLTRLSVKNQIARSKFIPEEKLCEFKNIKEQIKEQINSLMVKKLGKDGQCTHD